MFFAPVYCVLFFGEVWSFSENVMHFWCAHITLTCDEVVNMVRNVAVNQPELKSTLYTRDDEIVVFSWLFAWMNVCRVNWVAFSEHVKCSNPILQNYLWAISTVLSYTLLNAMPIDMMINFSEFYFFFGWCLFLSPYPKSTANIIQLNNINRLCVALDNLWLQTRESWTKNKMENKRNKRKQI